MLQKRKNMLRYVFFNLDYISFLIVFTALKSVIKMQSITIFLFPRHLTGIAVFQRDIIFSDKKREEQHVQQNGFDHKKKNIIKL